MENLSPICSKANRVCRVAIQLLPTTLFAALVACSGSSATDSSAAQLEKRGQPVPVASTSPPPTTTTTTTTPSFSVGMNVENSIYYSTERSFANLAEASAVWRDPNAGLANIPDTGLSGTGYPVSSGVLYLNVPNPVRSGISTSVTCTWAGSGTVAVNGNGGYAAASPGAHTLTFNWPGAAGGSLETSYFL